ncbi:hypothetical protein FKM82_027470 [Ascaphus truei]
MDSSSTDTEDPSAPLLSVSPPAGDSEDDAFAVLARMTQPPDTVPWEQRSLKMKIVHVADRVFLSFLAMFLLLLLGEVLYIVYHTTPWGAIYRGLTQEEGEEEEL